MASSSNSISESSFLDVNIKNYVPINLTYCSSTYVDWKSQIIHVLKSFKLDGHVTGKSVCPSPCLSDYSFWVRKEATVIFWLYATLSPDVHKHIHGIDILQNIFGIDFPTERQTCTLSARQIWLAIELLFRHQPIEYPAPDSDTQSMADWSQLPKDLLSSIAQRLEICFDSTHFRSVCSSWRSSAPPKPCLLPAKFPLSGYDFKRVKSFDLYKCIIVLIRFPKQPDQWLQDHRLVMIMEDKAKGMHLMNPLSNSRINCSSLYYRINCSSLLDFMNCQVIELSRQYVVHYEPGYRGYIGKVACMCSSTEENYHVLLVDHLHKKLAMLSSRDKRWTALENMSKSWEDIISFNGKFYAIDKLGRTTVVEPSLNVSSLATVGFGTRRQFLIESGSELLLVQMFLSANHFGMNMGDKQKCFPSSLGRLRFKVYKLNEARQKWEHVECLGDDVLFLGIYGAFSASASKFVWSSRNSIYFSLNSICVGLPIINSHQISIEDMFVFNYKNGRVDPLHNCPGFTKLFSPPPDWVTSTTK